MASYPVPLEPEDVLELPLPDGVEGFELVDGVPVPVSPASFRHGDLIVRVVTLLHSFVQANGLGKVISDVGVVLGLKRDPKRTRAPDVAFISRETLAIHGDPGEKFARFVPELAIEIDLSSARKPGGKQRIRDYLEAGVRLVWAIDAGRRSATVYRQDGTTELLNESDALDGEDVLPGFRLPIASLFN